MVKYLRINNFLEMLSAGPFICYFTEYDNTVNTELGKRIASVALRFTHVPTYRISWKKVSKTGLFPYLKITQVFYVMKSSAYEPIENPDIPKLLQYFNKVESIIRNQIKINLELSKQIKNDQKRPYTATKKILTRKSKRKSTSSKSLSSWLILPKQRTNPINILSTEPTSNIVKNTTSDNSSVQKLNHSFVEKEPKIKSNRPSLYKINSNLGRDLLIKVLSRLKKKIKSKNNQDKYIETTKLQEISIILGKERKSQKYL